MLAFVPIDGRPMDVMVKNFLKALPAENQYIYKKRGAESLISKYFSQAPINTPKPAENKPQQTNSLEEKRRLLYGALKKSYRPDANEEALLSNINKYLNESTHSSSPSNQNVDILTQEKSPTQIVTPTQEPSNPVKVIMPAVVPPVETPIAKPSPVVQNADLTPQTVADATPINPELSNQTQVIQQPEMLSMPDEVVTVKNTQPHNSVNPNESQNASSIKPDAILKAGFPTLPDTPNVVLGIIKDPRGKILPNMLVEIMDMQGIPVRAFKTNSLGQFAAATPLPDGEYNVLIEDPRKQHEFEQIHIKLDGNIFEPLEIISTDQREKLRQELFGGNKQQQSQSQIVTT